MHRISETGHQRHRRSSQRPRTAGPTELQRRGVGGARAGDGRHLDRRLLVALEAEPDPPERTTGVHDGDREVRLPVELFEGEDSAIAGADPEDLGYRGPAAR